MPLQPGKSQKVISKNIDELHQADPNRSNAQNVAIALHEAHIKPKPENGGEIHLRHNPNSTPNDLYQK